jgi:hypothetical protein
VVALHLSAFANWDARPKPEQVACSAEGVVELQFLDLGHAPQPGAGCLDGVALRQKGSRDEGAQVDLRARRRVARFRAACSGGVDRSRTCILCLPASTAERSCSALKTNSSKEDIVPGVGPGVRQAKISSRPHRQLRWCRSRPTFSHNGRAPPVDGRDAGAGADSRLADRGLPDETA